MPQRIALEKYVRIFFQIGTIFVGMGAVMFLIWEPQVEGRNIGASLSEIYFQDPFLAYVYIASLPFFVILYQIFRGIASIGRDISTTLYALRIIRFCAIIMIGFVMLGEGILFSLESDDRAGGVFLGVLFLVFFVSLLGGTSLLRRFLEKEKTSL